MTTSQNNDRQPTSVGEVFARLYLERGAPVQDSLFFRNRLEAYLVANHFKDYGELSNYLKQESGLVVAASYLEKSHSFFYNFPEFFAKTRIELVLGAITLIWRFLRNKYVNRTKTGTTGNPDGLVYPKAEAWHGFVARALREENMAYSLDEKCGVHYFVDEEFERNRVSVVKCLEAPRYSGVRAAFEATHGYLDAQPSDTKASVRAAFEAIEILARLMEPQSKNLNKWLVENKLKALALSSTTDATEADTIGKVFDGLALLIDGLHNYRHGQGVQQPVAPSLTFSVYVISVAAAALRWLVEIDSKQPKALEAART